jgi:predicted PurR-regulated permease PerM
MQAQDINQKEPTINAQFSELIESANNYQEYKVVKHALLLRLQEKTKVKIDELNKNIQQLEDSLNAKQNRIEKLNRSLSSTQEDLDLVNSEKNNIQFLGISTDKSTYQSIMWGVVFVLLIILLFFIYKFKSSNAATREAKQNLQECEAEFDDYKKRALEKQQRLGRQLQDEINRNKA